MFHKLKLKNSASPAFSSMKDKDHLSAHLSFSKTVHESEGITENVREWRRDVRAKIIDGLGVEKSDVRA